jgi:hypothetical protein
MVGNRSTSPATQGDYSRSRPHLIGCVNSGPRGSASGPAAKDPSHTDTNLFSADRGHVIPHARGSGHRPSQDEYRRSRPHLIGCVKRGSSGSASGPAAKDPSNTETKTNLYAMHYITLHYNATGGHVIPHILTHKISPAELLRQISPHRLCEQRVQRVCLRPSCQEAFQQP